MMGIIQELGFVEIGSFAVVWELVEEGRFLGFPQSIREVTCLYRSYFSFGRGLILNDGYNEYDV